MKLRVLAIVFSLLLLEFGATFLLYHNYRVNTVLADKSPIATIALIQRVVDKIDGAANLNSLNRNEHPEREKVTSIPYPFLIKDKVQGYKMRSGEFSILYRGTDKHPNSLFRFRVKVMQDGTRFIGSGDKRNNSSAVHIFGDSFVFGEGVNDEQTFTYLLNSKIKEAKFKLWAAPGYSLGNALLQIRETPNIFGQEDIILLFYAGYFDIRHVQAPSRIRAYGKPRKSLSDTSIKVPRFLLQNDSLKVSYTSIFCEYSGNYCNQPDPKREEMQNVTVEILREIKRLAKSKIVLVYFWGSDDEKLLDCSKIAKAEKVLVKAEELGIEVHRFDPCSFEYFVADNIAGFDSHPGPFWHYEMSKRLEPLLLNLLK